MNDQVIRKAIASVCQGDNMNANYERALAALIENTMRNNLDISDIARVLDMIPIPEAADED